MAPTQATVSTLTSGAGDRQPECLCGLAQRSIACDQDDLLTTKRFGGRQMNRVVSAESVGLGQDAGPVDDRLGRLHDVHLAVQPPKPGDGCSQPRPTDSPAPPRHSERSTGFDVHKSHPDDTVSFAPE